MKQVIELEMSGVPHLVEIEEVVDSNTYLCKIVDEAFRTELTAKVVSHPSEIFAHVASYTGMRIDAQSAQSLSDVLTIMNVRRQLQQHRTRSSTALDESCTAPQPWIAGS